MLVFILMQISALSLVLLLTDGQYLSIPKCPTDRDSHEKRAKDFVCASGKHYHCMPTTDRKFVEFCMDVLSLVAKDGCPVIESFVDERPNIVQINCSKTNEDVCALDGFLFTNMLFQYKGCLDVYNDYSTPYKTMRWNNSNFTSNLWRTDTPSTEDEYSAITSKQTTEVNGVLTESKEVNDTNYIGASDSINHPPNIIVVVLAGAVASLLVSLFIRGSFQCLQVARLENTFDDVDDSPKVSVNTAESVVVIEMEDGDIYQEITTNTESADIGVDFYNGSRGDSSDDDDKDDRTHDDEQTTANAINDQSISS